MAQQFSVQNTINLIRKNQQKAVNIAMEQGKVGMVQEIQSGKRDVKPYSASYAKYRLKKGRGLAVDLTWTGTLLRGVFSTALRAKDQVIGRVSITGKAASGSKTNKQILLYQIAMRPGVWGFSQANWRRVIDTLKRELKI